MTKEKAAFLVPTLATGLRAVEMAQRAGVPMAYGTDLLGVMHRRQLTEFELRADVVPPADLIRAATANAARLIRREADLGRIAPGCIADLIPFPGDPLRDIRLMGRLDQNLKLIMRNGMVDRG